MANALYYGDNLEVLRRYVADESVDLIYLDPPFKSDQDYNVLFAEHDQTRSTAQINAFEDTWEWNTAAAEAFDEAIQSGHGRTPETMAAFRTMLGPSDMMAYLSMMAPRLIQLHRVLKSTGSIYLHCDPTASHYLKLLMDAIFDPRQFRNEITWRRTGAHNKLLRYGPIHDILLFYTKSDDYKWNHPKRPYMLGHVQENFVEDELGYRTNYYGNVLTGSGTRGGESGQIWRGFDPTAKGRHWAVPGAVVEDMEETGVSFEGLGQHQKLDLMLEHGFIKIIEGQAWPIYERRIRETDGQAIQDIWAFQPYTEGTVFGSEQGIDADVRWLSPKDQERLGYPTQKPEGLLERIIGASCSAGDHVLDPFCGCGTTIAAAHKLGRQWTGIDVTHLATNLIKHRLLTGFGVVAGTDYQVVGEPTDLEGAIQLAEDNKFQFQAWALGLVGARVANSGKRGADKGIDGRLFFHDDARGAVKSVVLSVKGGATGVADVRDLRGVLDREGAPIGVLITLHEPTRPMRQEAASAEFYDSPWLTRHPRLQVLTVAELLEGKRIDMPPVGQTNVTFKQAPKAKRRPNAKQRDLDM